MKKVFLLVLLLVNSALQATAYQWGSVDGSVSWDGAATGGLIAQNNVAFASEELPISYDGTITTTQYGIFHPTPEDSLTLTDVIKIQGDVEIRFTGELAASEHEYFEINIGTPETADVPVSLQAYTDDATTIEGFSQLIINTAQGKTTVVNVYADLDVVSADALDGYDAEDADSVGAPIPFVLTIRGQGTCVFRLPSGRSLYFGPQNPGNFAEGAYEATDPLSVTGVAVRVYMEQTSLDVYGGAVEGGSILPRSQLVFEKWSYNADEVNADTSLDTWITFGQLSSFVFISDNYQGVSESWVDINGNNDLDLGEPPRKPGYGSIAFDPSSAGTGRLILQIARGQLPSGNDFTDAGFNLYGALLVPTLPVSDRVASTILNADFRTGIYFNQRAGIRALMRITSDVEFYERTYPGVGDLTKETWITRPDSDRRGLVVLNHNNTIPLFANNYDLADRIDECVWAQFNDYQPGFIVGVNGGIEVKSHLFLDYYANNTNKAITDAHADHDTSHSKKHNPAALYMDGLPSFDKRSRRQADQFDVPISDILYMGHHPEFGTKPIIQLEGDSLLYVRACAPFNEYALINPLFPQMRHHGLYHMQPLSGDDSFVMSCGLGIGVYDGVFIPIVDGYNNLVMQSTEPEGSHAIDIEGPAVIYSMPGALGEEPAGVVNVPSLEIDYAGREVMYDNFLLWLSWQDWLSTTEDFASTTVTLADGTVVVFTGETDIALTQSPVTSRPLSTSYTYYTVHDVSSMMINDELIMDTVTWKHDDVTRNLKVPLVIPQPFMAARPHVVGAEYAGLVSALTPPSISFYNSTLALHESIVMAGVALAVTEIPETAPEYAHNSSRIISYNRGKEYDIKGYGRVLQLGSQGNIATDGVSTSLLLNSAYCDVYRAARTYGATVDDQTTIQLTVTTAQESTVSPVEKSLHMIYLANASQIRLGWPTLEGDSGYKPATMDSVILAELNIDDPSNKNKTRFSAYETGLGHLICAGGPYVIGAGDSVDALAPEVPIIGRDIDGVVYVNHGGKLSVTNSADLYVSTVIARRTAVESEAAGVLSLPRDQVHFLVDGVVQNYSVDFALDQSLVGPHAHHVEYNLTESVHLFDVPLLYETSDVDQVK